MDKSSRSEDHMEVEIIIGDRKQEERKEFRTVLGINKYFTQISTTFKPLKGNDVQEKTPAQP